MFDGDVETPLGRSGRRWSYSIFVGRVAAANVRLPRPPRAVVVDDDVDDARRRRRRCTGEGEEDRDDDDDDAECYERDNRRGDIAIVLGIIIGRGRRGGCRRRGQRRGDRPGRRAVVVVVVVIVGGGGESGGGGKSSYLGDPTVTPTALAHALWRSTILPYSDTVVDATCGNGKDLLALAGMLFPPRDSHTNSNSNGDHGGGGGGNGDGDGGGRLIGIDVQSRAMRNTERSLSSSSSSSFDYGAHRDRVSLLVRSHENLLDVVRPYGGGDVGLVCYNLGYLPGGDDKKSGGMTQTDTTLRSVTDAAILLRIGGLLSVMTYPASNFEESVAVERFAEGLGMLTTRDEAGWRGYADGIPDDDDGLVDGGGGGEEEGAREGRVRTMVTRALERVVDEGAAGQTWRAFVHRPLGRPLSPVLVTATRIK